MHMKEKTQHDSYIYNTIAGLLNAFQSVFILMALNRVLGLEAAGIFTLAYAVANLMLNIGKYGMRNFQATDVSTKYSSTDYVLSRVITTVMMMTASILYIIYTSKALSYNSEKTLVIIFMCIWKCVDSVEDVYQGELQRRGRLDLGAKEFTYRQIISIILFIGGSLLFRNLLTVTVVTAVGSIVAAVVLTIIALNEFGKNISSEKKNATTEISEKNMKEWHLLKECFPLFVSAFLAFYLINASKYAIDAVLSPEDQARYGFISMPVFVVGLLAQFIYMPILKQLADQFASGKLILFRSSVKKQVLIIIGITAVVMAGGFLIGCPVLSIIYGTDLIDLKVQLTILLLGSGLLAYGNLMWTILTLMRKTHEATYAYGVSALFELFFARIMVERGGLMGASLSLMFGMAILAIIMFITYVRKIGEIVEYE